MRIINEQLPVVFKKFYESHKSAKGNVDSRFLRGKNGYGRFSFFKFANLATWNTIYKKGDEFYKYNIGINAQTLTDYNTSNPEQTAGVPYVKKSSGVKIVPFFNCSIRPDITW